MVVEVTSSDKPEAKVSVLMKWKLREGLPIETEEGRATQEKQICCHATLTSFAKKYRKTLVLNGWSS